MPSPPNSIPVRVNQTPNASDDYISRALLSSYLTSGASALVAIFAKEGAQEALPQRVLSAAGIAQASSNPALNVLDRVVEGVIGGSDLSPAYPEIARLIHAQDQRAEIIGQLALTHDYSRLARALRAREKLEENLFTAAMNDDLLPAERVILLEKLESIITTARKAMGAESTSINDIQAMLEKIDFATEQAGAGLRKKFAQTTPQGREVVRKLLLTVSKRVGGATRTGEGD